MSKTHTIEPVVIENLASVQIHVNLWEEHQPGGDYTRRVVETMRKFINEGSRVAGIKVDAPRPRAKYPA